MDPEVPMRANRRGLRRRLLIALSLLPIAGFILGNLWLSSPPGRNWIAAKIQHRSGLETRIGGTLISPWDGICVRQVELLQPQPLRGAIKQPLASIAMIRIVPVWRSWLRGGRDLSSVELDSPQLVIPLELIAELIRARPPAPVAGPPLAAASPPARMPASPPAATTVVPSAPPSPSTPPATPPTPPTPAAPPIQLAPTSWLHLKNASFTLLTASSGKPWFQVSGTTGSIPVAGRAAVSSLAIRSIQIAGHETLSGVKSTLDWTAPLLSLRPLETEAQGIKFILAGKLALLSGLPLLIEAQVPKQKLTSFQLPANGRADAESIVANGRFRALLLAPATWQGDFVAEALSPSASIGGNDAKFDRGSAVTVLRGGILSCVDARLIGDNLSFLGNATLLGDGRTAGALRMVAPPDAIAAIAKRVFPKLPQDPSLTDLSTPQRAAFDLEALGTFQQILLRIGKDGPVVALKH